MMFASILCRVLQPLLEHPEDLSRGEQPVGAPIVNSVINGRQSVPASARAHTHTHRHTHTYTHIHTTHTYANTHTCNTHVHTGTHTCNTHVHTGTHTRICMQ
jgi:hypothetical protein